MMLVTVKALLKVEVVLKNTKEHGRVAVLEKPRMFSEIPRVGDTLLVGSKISSRWFKVMDVVWKEIDGVYFPDKVLIEYTAPEKVSNEEVKKDEEQFYAHGWKLLGSGVHAS